MKTIKINWDLKSSQMLEFWQRLFKYRLGLTEKDALCEFAYVDGIFSLSISTKILTQSFMQERMTEILPKIS